MDIPQELTDEITALNSAIEQRPDDADAYIALLREIFAFRHFDLYNP